jgi:uncharacterized protein (DUF433 family)
MTRAVQKAEPFSIRLRKEDDHFVKEEARRLRRSRGAIVEAYASEAIRMRRYPGIAFRGEDYRRRAWVLGTGLDVWEIVALLRDFTSEREVIAEYQLTPGQIRVALAYHRDFREEVDELIARGRRSEEELRSGYPFIQTFDEAVADGGA